MPMIFTIKRQTLKQVSRDKVVADSLKYLKAKFIFSEEWNGLEKTALFSRNGEIYPVELADDECEVPWQVLQTQGIFTLGVIASGGDIQLVTANSVNVVVYPSVLNEGGEDNKEPTTLYQKLHDTLSDTSSSAKDAQKAEQGALDAEQGALDAEQRVQEFVGLFYKVEFAPPVSRMNEAIVLAQPSVAMLKERVVK